MSLHGIHMGSHADPEQAGHGSFFAPVGFVAAE